ncbi:hypothetical protein [Corynebacterium sp.]|uniref:hypothetical protein n=1 Tax=Corynebacterium sp. TaxID=1720 RepID=UPI0026DFBECE|nr:hypothetical protein [Corynebacterium sp.]MDO5512794.1 hypothetical protein [Corynebacterium sp.]
MTAIFDDLDTRIRSIDHPRARAALERWLFAFVSENRRFSVPEALLLGWQWSTKWNIETIISDSTQDWLLHPEPATLAEWAAEGFVVNPDALPLLLPAADGGTVEYHTLYDTVSVEDDESEVRPSARLEPLPAHPEAHDYAEFAGRVDARGRVMLGHLWQIGTVVEWGTEFEDCLHWVREGSVDRVLPARPDMRGDDSFLRCIINTDTAGWDVMTLVLRFLAETAATMTLGRRARRRVRGYIGDHTSHLELGLAADLARRRLGVGEFYPNGDVHHFWEEADEAQPADVRWWLVYQAAQLIEDLLLGHGPGPDPDPEVGIAKDLLLSPLPYINDQLMSLWPNDSAAAATWVRDFVTANPRYPVPEAAQLAWQLRERLGDDLDSADVAEWAGEVDIRTVEEWEACGFSPRAGAQPLYSLGSHGGVVRHHLRDDVEVEDWSTALLDDTLRWERNDPGHHRPPPEGTPALVSLVGHVDDYEHALLRNATEVCLHVEVVDVDEDLDLWSGEGDEEMFVPVIATPLRSVMRMAMDRLVNVIVATQSGTLLDSDPVDGRFPVPCSLLEEELAVYVAARRLGVDPGALSVEGEAIVSGGGVPPSDLVRWGLVLDAADALEDVLRGYRWRSSD